MALPRGAFSRHYPSVLINIVLQKRTRAFIVGHQNCISEIHIFGHDSVKNLTVFIVYLAAFVIGRPPRKVAIPDVEIIKLAAKPEQMR